MILSRSRPLHSLTRLVVSAAITLGLSVCLTLAAEPKEPGDELPVPEMTAEQMDGVRAKIKKYSDYSDEQLLKMMAVLRNESGMLSTPDTQGQIGLLVLAHGFHGEGFTQFTQAFAQAISNYPTAYGFGLGIMSSEFLQKAVDGLEAAGASTIVLIPTSTAKNSTMVRQWQYAFGTIDEPAYLDVPRVSSEAHFVWASNPMDHPIVGEILRDHALAVSNHPAKELVIVLGHGPSEAEDNKRELDILRGHADFVKHEAGFNDVKVANVQDDAPDDTRKANVDKIRGWITDAQSRGNEVIVVTTVLTESGVLRKLENDVKDLGITFNDTGLMMHPRFVDWLDETIQQVVGPLN